MLRLLYCPIRIGALAFFWLLPTATASEAAGCSEATDVISLGDSRTIHDWDGGRDGRRIFQLRLADKTAIRAFTTGTADVAGSIFSASNDELVAWSTTPWEENVRIDALLPGGTYCLRTQASDAGTYDLHVVAADGDYDRDHNIIDRAPEVRIRSGKRQRVRGLVEWRGDVDYYRLAVDAVGRLSVSSHSEIGLMGRLLVADESGWDYLVDAQASTSDHNFAIDLPVELGKRYYLVVTRETDELGAYELEISLDVKRDVGDTVDHATPITVGTLVEGRIQSADDIDYYFIGEGMGQLHIFSLGSVDVYGTLMTEGEQEVAADDDGGEAANFSIRADIFEPHYLRVHGVDGATGDFELVVSSQQDVRKDEGSSIADALELDVGIPVEAVFEGNREDSLHVFKIRGQGRVQIETEGLLDLRGALTTAEGLLVAEDDDSGSGGNFRMLPSLDGATYYLHIANLEEKGGAYRVLVRPDETRPDDDADLALSGSNPVKLGSRIAGTIQPPGDVDYYRIHLESGMGVQVYTEGETDTVGDLFPEGVSIYDADDSGRDNYPHTWAALESNDDGGEGTNFLIMAYLERGDYFIRVGGLYGTSGDYALVVDRFQDDHGDTRESASHVTGDVGRLSGVIAPKADVDYFWLPAGASEEARNVVVTTIGDLDTVGAAESESGLLLSEDDDGGVDTNFRLQQELVGKGIYVRVESFGSSVGHYTLVIE